MHKSDRDVEQRDCSFVKFENWASAALVGRCTVRRVDLETPAQSHTLSQAKLPRQCAKFGLVHIACSLPGLIVCVKYCELQAVLLVIIKPNSLSHAHHSLFSFLLCFDATLLLDVIEICGICSESRKLALEV